MPSRPRIAVLLNASAGMPGAQRVDTLRDTLAVAFEQHRFSAALEVLMGSDLQAAAQHAVQRIRNQELGAIVVGGGDGSVRTVAHVLAETDIPLGILPLGTRNQFPRDLGIPTAMEEAVALIAVGQTALVDLGDVNGETFINNSSIGLYPYLVREREQRRRRGRGAKGSALLLSGLRVLRHLPLRRFTVTVAGSVELCRSPIVVIANNEYALKASVFGPRERLDGGEICI